jgi:phage/plasmid-associated DNA primase
MSTSLKEILKIHLTESVFYTHVSLISPKGKYGFTKTELEKFWKEYIVNVSENKYNLGIAEKPSHYLPVLADIDLKIKEVEDIKVKEEKIYNDEHIRQIVSIYQSVLRKIVEDCDDDTLLCVVLEKPMYRIEKNGVTYVKNGWHLQFPNCFLPQIDHEVHLIPRIEMAVEELKVFADIEYEIVGKIIDSGYCKAPWLLYKSIKEIGMESYTVSKIYNSNLENINSKEAFKNYEIYNDKEKIIDMKDNIEMYYPRILSILPYGRETNEIRSGILSPIKEKMKESCRHNTKNTEYKKISTNDAVKICKILLPMIADYRAQDYNEWITIGWILYNATDGTEEGLDLWCEFSSRANEIYDEATCIYQWERMVKKSLTLGTLRYYASIDSPEKYAEYKKSESDKHLDEALHGSHYDIAKILHTNYSDEFVCASITSKSWFQFRNHKWEQIEEGVFLRQKISEEIVKKYIKKGQEIFGKLANGGDKLDDAPLNLQLKSIQKMIEKLKSSPYKTNVMKEAMEIFYDRRFKEKLDTDAYKMVFKNGVYDFKLNLFRDGRPEDFLSKNLPINYVQFTENHQKVQEVYTFLEKVFPDKSLRRYFMDISSDIFVGGNPRKIVPVWQGEGDNAKSVTQTIFEKMFGPLAIKLNTTVVTGKKVGSGAANADLARAGGGVRLAVMEEPGGDEMINDGILNNLSGNDSFYARDLFEKGKDGREIQPLFKLILICLGGETSISLSSGISVSIKKLEENHKLLGWDEKSDGLLNINQKAFLNKGEQKCIQLTLLDGRTLICTPDHQLLTSNNTWIKAKNITLHNTQLKMGVNYPNGDDILDNYDYKFLDYNLNNYQDRLKSAAIARILGYLITDSTLNSVVYIGHQIDANNIINDIELLTNKRPKITKNRTVYQIYLPKILQDKISQLHISVSGPRVNNNITIPDFIFDDNCPLFLIKEFIAGMFGSDGIIPCIVKNTFSNIQLVASKELHGASTEGREKHVKSLVLIFNKISQLLLDKFNIKSIVSKPQYYENYSTDKSYLDKFNVFLKINKHSSMLQFIEKIGIRYCCHKTYRIITVQSVINYKNTITNLNNKLINRTKELFNKYNRQNPLPLILQIDNNNNIINTFISTQKAQHNTGLQHSDIRSAINRNGKCGGYKWIEKEQEKEILDEPGFKNIQESYTYAKNELKLNDIEYILTCNKIKYYIRNNLLSKSSIININDYLNKTNLNKFCNQNTGIFHYSVNKDLSVLPCYNMNVIDIKSVGIHNVYDLNVDEPYSNFIAEGIVTHNCNKLPRLRYNLKATWNRIRVILFESTFVRPGDPEGVPETYEEQLRQKRFPMDPNFNEKIPAMLEAFAWVLLEHRKTVTIRIEPEKVRTATLLYRKQNDIYREFMDESIVEDSKCSLTLTEVYTQFKEWFKESMPNHSLPIKKEVEEYFFKLWGEPDKGKRWSGYRIKNLQDELERGETVMMEQTDLVDYENGHNLPI